MSRCSCQDHAEPNTCAACRFGACPGCTYPNRIDCRRHAPVKPVDDDDAVWPRVARHYWCGDFEPFILAVHGRKDEQ